MGIEKGAKVVAAIDIRCVDNEWVRPDPESIAVRTVVERGTPGEIAANEPEEIRVKFRTGSGLGTEIDDIWIARSVFGTYTEPA